MRTTYPYNKEKYIDHTVILAMLTRDFPNKQWDEANVIEWCQHVENNILGNVDAMVRYIDYPVKVINGRAQIPCFAHKVFSYSKTKDTHVDVSTRKFENYLSVYDDIKHGEIFLSFVGMPIDLETGSPLILKGHEDICYWFCVKSAHTEAYFTGELDHSRWEYMDAKVAMYSTEVLQSLRDFDEKDYKNLSFILGTNVGHLGGYVRMKLY